MYLIHYGTKGQKWGVRRYQNPDGTYTEEGKRRRQSQYTSEVTTSIATSIKKRDLEGMSKSIGEVNKRYLSQDQIKRLSEASWKTAKLDRKIDSIQEDAMNYANNHPSVIDKYGNFDDDKWIDLANGYMDKHGYTEIYNQLESSAKSYRNECKKVADELLGDIGKNTTITLKQKNQEAKLDIPSIVSENLAGLNYRSRDGKWIVY